MAFDASGSLLDYPTPVRHFGDDVKVEVQPKPAAFMHDQPLQAVAVAAVSAPVMPATMPFGPQRQVSPVHSVLDDVDLGGLASPADDFARGQFLHRGTDGRLRTETDPFDRMPTAVRALADLRDEVQAEDRRDLVCGLADLRMTDKIQLAREATEDREGFEVRVESAAIGRLQAELRAASGADGDLGIATHAASSRPTLRLLASTVWNGYADALAVKEKAGADRSTVTLRTRMVEQRGSRETGLGSEIDAAVPLAPRARQVYAVVSEKYGECDANKIAAGCLRLVERVGGDLRARVAYRRGDSSVRIDIFTQQREVAQVGDEFRATMRCKSNDAGKGGLKVWSTVERLACENGMVVAIPGAATLIRHLGDPTRLQERLREALAASLSSLRQFSEQWRRASTGGIWLGVEALERAQRDSLKEIVNDVLARSARADLLAGLSLSTPGQALLDGTYRAMLRQHELAPVKNLEEQVIALRAAHWDSRNEGGARAQAGGLTRAAMANGLTMWAKGQPVDVAHEAEVLAGRVVSGDEVLGWIAAKN